MATFEIKIDLGNAAFEDTTTYISEIKNVLNGMYSRLPTSPRQTQAPLKLYDSNGNCVGSARIKRGASRVT